VSRPRISIVTVDFWGTILLDGPGSDERYRARRLNDFATILSAAGSPVKGADLAHAYGQSMSYLAAIWRHCRDVPVEAHVRAILNTVDPGLAARLSPDAMAKLVEAYSRPALMVPPTVDPGALAALEALCVRGYTLAVVSNTMRTPGVVMRKILERYHVLGCFKHTTFSDEVGIRKPDPEIFAMTLRALGGEPQTAIHVGDDTILDVEGARAAGMRVIQVTGASREQPGAAQPDRMIRRLSELPDAVAALDA
jgi:putative hydrolase of the HAD superfamily